MVEKNTSLVRFVQKMTALRMRYPILRHNRFLTGAHDEELEVKDLTWINAPGNEMRAGGWQDARIRCFGMLMVGRAPPTGLRQRGTEATMLPALNAHHELVEFTLPVCTGGDHWALVLDTNARTVMRASSFASGTTYGITARSPVLFALVA